MSSREPWVFRDRCSISGIGATDFSRASGRSVLTLATEASLAAIADAGLTVDDVDGIVRSEADTVHANDLADALRLPDLTYWGDSGRAGASPCAMVAQACAAVISGLARNVLVFRALNGRSGVRFGQRARPAVVGGGNTYDEFFIPAGMTAPGQCFAMLAQRHMVEFGTTEEQVGAIAIACRRHANANPAAQMHDRPLDLAGYLTSPMLSTPLRLLDYCLETDGACALVVSRTDRVADPSRAVRIRAVAQVGSGGLQGGQLYPALMRPSLTTQTGARVADLLYQRGGLGPADVDVAQIYDCFTINVLLQLEDYGFCAKGEGGPFAASGALTVGGELPINTAGGNLSEAYIHGLNHVVEGVRQMRGESTNQVAGAEVGLVTSGPPPATSALLLRSAA